MSIKSRLDKLFKELNADKITIQLKDGETLYLDNTDLTKLLVEKIENAEVIGRNGQVISKPDKNKLSDTARKLKKAKPGELDKLPDILKF